MKYSTGFLNHLCVTGSVRGALDGGNIKFYSGSEPATADAATTGTLLLTVTASGAGLTFNTTAAARVLTKPSATTWSGTPAANGDAGYFRFVASGDTGASSTTEKRMQGAVSTFGADINLASITMATSTARTLASFWVSLLAQTGALKFSDMLANYLLDTGSLKAALDGCKIMVFAGTEPTSPESANANTLLCTVTLSGGGSGLTWDTTPVNGALLKPAAASWSGTNVASGDATHFRLVLSADDGISASTTARRVQGSIGVGGKDWIMSNVTFVSGNSFTPSEFHIALPAAA